MLGFRWRSVNINTNRGRVLGKVSCTKNLPMGEYYSTDLMSFDLPRDILIALDRGVRIHYGGTNPPGITSPPVLVIKHIEYGWPQIKRSQIQTRTSSRYPVSGASVTLGSGESFPYRIQSSGDNGTRMLNILPGNLVVHRSVPVDGSTQLGLRSHPIGSSTLEALTMTFSFFRSDELVCTTAAFRPCI